jgi:hypothetical protein
MNPVNEGNIEMIRIAGCDFEAEVIRDIYAFELVELAIVTSRGYSPMFVTYEEFQRYRDEYDSSCV